MYLFLAILIPVVLLAGTIGLTLAIEFPIVYYSGITRNKNYIVAVNALTNVCLNSALVLVLLLSDRWINIVTLVLELTAIPIAESILYLKISKAHRLKVWLITYLANFTSFFLGLFAVEFIRFGSADGISKFFKAIF